MKILMIFLALFFVQSSYARRFIVSEKEKNTICIAMCDNGENYSFIISLPQFGGSIQDKCNVEGAKLCDSKPRGRIASPEQGITPLQK